MPNETLKLYLISGAPRSGTTMLQKILNTHSEVGCLHEQSELLGVINNLTKSYKNINSALLIQGNKYDGIYYPSISPHNIKKIFINIWNTVFFDRKLSVIANKIPNITVDESDNYYQYGIVLKHIIILRNPIDVINSSLARRNKAIIGLDEWHIHSVENAIDEWTANWHFAVANYNNADFLFIKYENILEDFQIFNSEVAHFMGVSPSFIDTNGNKKSIISRYNLDVNEMEIINNYFGLMINNWNTLSITEILDPDLKLRYPLIRNKLYKIGLDIIPVTFSGFSTFESGWVWSIDRKSDLSFKIIKGERITKLVLEVSIYGNLISYVYAKVHQNSWRKYSLINFDGEKGRVEIDIIDYKDETVDDIFISLCSPVYKKPNDEPRHDPRSVRFAIHSLLLL